jgi:hypothetical protein
LDDLRLEGRVGDFLCVRHAAFLPSRPGRLILPK